MRRELNLDKHNEDVGFVVLPKGSYQVEIYSAKEQRSRAGNETVLVAYNVLNDEYKNAKVFEYLTLTEKSMGRIKHFLHMIKEPYENDPVPMDTGNWIGQCLKIDVAIETSQDYPDKNRVVAHWPFEPAEEEAYKEKKKAKARESYQAKKQTAKETKDEKRNRQEHEFGNEMAEKNKDEDIPF